MKPEDFQKSHAWKALDRILGKLADECDGVVEVYKAAGMDKAAGPVAVALQLWLAEKITANLGEFREGLEPLIAEFRAADALATRMGNERSRDVH